MQRRDSEHIGRVILKIPATRQEAKKKTKEKIHGCGEKGYSDNRCEKRRCKGQGKMKEDNSPVATTRNSWVKLKEKEEVRSRSDRYY